MKKFFSSRAGISLLTAAAAAGTVLFPCAEIYLRNRDFFSLPLHGALLFGAAGYLILFAACSTVLLLFRKTRIFPILNAFFLSFGISLLLQYLYWSTLFPEQTSDCLLSPDMLIVLCFHLFFLLLPIVLAVYFSQFCCRHAPKLACIILFTQLVSITAAFFHTDPQNYDFTEYSISEKTKFEFARKENIIVLVVDAMGERLCKETMQKFPELKNSLHDFTCFDRMVSPIPKTIYAVPAILTGMEYVQNDDNEEDHAEYLNKSCHAPNSIFQGLRRCGFRTEGYPFILQTISYRPDVIDNSTPITYQAQKQSAITILDAALSRMIPVFIKPLLEKYYYFATDRFVTPQDTETITQERVPFDITFYQKLQKEFRIGDRDKVFKYLHLHGAHDPVRTDEFLKENRETSKLRQLRGSLKIAETLLEKLKVANLYDDSIIIIMGDHTEFYMPENIAFIKRKQEHHEVLRYNSVPCKVADIAATVLKESGCVSGLTSLFDLVPVWSSGNCRKDAQIPNLTFTPWEKTQAPQIDDFSLFSNAFHLQKDKILLDPDSELHEQMKTMTLFLKNILTGACWQSRPRAWESDFRFLETPSLNVPDGAYQVFLQIPGISEYEKCNIQSLPLFLLISAGKYRWTSQYPGQSVRAIYPGEEIKFHPMHPYPQIEFCDGSEFRNDVVFLGKDHSLKIHLPALAENTSLLLTLKHHRNAEGVLSVRDENRVLAGKRIGETDKSVFVIPLAHGPEKYLKLKFEFMPQKLKRDALYNRFHFQIQKIHLEKAADTSV